VEESQYLQKQKEEQEKYEALCSRCGACCGALDGDPCINLAKDSSDKYYCKVYDNRIGVQSTVSGKTFACMPIREIFRFKSPYPNCAYFK